MIQDRAFIITASRIWDEPKDNNMRAMAEEIAIHSKVIYVNPPDNGAVILSQASVKNRGDGVGSRKQGVITHPIPNVWVIEPPIVTFALDKVYSEEAFNILNEGNCAQYANVIKWAANQLGIGWTEIYLLLGNEMAMCQHLAELLPARLAIAYCNEFELSNIPHERIAKLKQAAAKNSDIMITTNAKAASELRQYNYNTFNIGKGVDLSNYQLERSYSTPLDIEDIDTKIVGCAGTISSLYISHSIIHQIAMSCPNVTIVMLGKKDPLAAKHPVYSMPNVRFLGIKSDDELPAYVSAFDVCIDPAIPQHHNPRYRNAIANYLALGKSVICSNMEHTLSFRDHVMVADSESEFVRKVKRALDIRMPWSIRYKRAEFAHTFSWSKCVERLYVVIDMVETDRNAKNLESEGSKTAFD